MLTIKTNNVEETEKLANYLATLATSGMVITLEGDLGAGKTSFVRGFAKGLGIVDRVKSPTFTLLKIYESGHIPLYHMDVYRLEDSEADEGLIDYIYGNGVAVIEWAQFIAADLPEDKLEITIQFISEHEREIIFTGSGQIYEQVIQELKTYWSEKS